MICGSKSALCAILLALPSGFSDIFAQTEIKGMASFSSRNTSQLPPLRGRNCEIGLFFEVEHCRQGVARNPESRHAVVDVSGARLIQETFDQRISDISQQKPFEKLF
jgi:hypothetical protein